MRVPRIAPGCAAVLALLGAGCDDAEVASQSSDVASAPEHRWEVKPKQEGNLRFATFNIRNFPEVPPPPPEEAGPVDETATSGTTTSTRKVTHLQATDVDALVEVLVKLDFDVLAVQEIRDPAALDEVLMELGDRVGTTYASAYSANEVSGNDQQVGLVARADRAVIADVTEHPEVDVRGTLRSGLSARVTSRAEGGVDLGVMVLHLASGESVKRAALRAEQAAVVADVVAERAATFADADFLLLGDFNTAREDEELPALDAALSRSRSGSGTGLARAENPDGCTSYYVKNKIGVVAPSTIDQVYAASLEELDREVPLVSGAHCAERLCQAFESDGPESGTSYWAVSDHCPVYFEIADVDRDP